MSDPRASGPPPPPAGAPDLTRLPPPAAPAGRSPHAPGPQAGGPGLTVGLVLAVLWLGGIGSAVGLWQAIRTLRGRDPGSRPVAWITATIAVLGLALTALTATALISDAVAANRASDRPRQLQVIAIERELDTAAELLRWHYDETGLPTLARTSLATVLPEHEVYARVTVEVAWAMTDRLCLEARHRSAPGFVMHQHTDEPGSSRTGTCPPVP